MPVPSREYDSCFLVSINEPSISQSMKIPPHIPHFFSICPLQKLYNSWILTHTQTQIKIWHLNFWKFVVGKQTPLGLSSDFITFFVCILDKFAYSQIKQDGLEFQILGTIWLLDFPDLSRLIPMHTQIKIWHLNFWKFVVGKQTRLGLSCE
jgi:hypothetical protein